MDSMMVLIVIPSMISTRSCPGETTPTIHLEQRKQLVDKQASIRLLRARPLDELDMLVAVHVVLGVLERGEVGRERVDLPRMLEDGSGRGESVCGRVDKDERALAAAADALRHVHRRRRRWRGRCSASAPASARLGFEKISSAACLRPHLSQPLPHDAV